MFCAPVAEFGDHLFLFVYMQYLYTSESLWTFKGLQEYTDNL